MRLMRLQSIVCRLDRRLFGLPAAPGGTPFASSHAASRTDRPPIREDRVHSLVSASPLRSLSAAPSGLLFRVGTTLPGFLPSSRHHRWCPPARELPTSRCVPSSGFRNPSTVFSTIRICGLIASRCHVQGSFRSGISPDSQLLRLVTGRFPHAVVVLPLHRQAGSHVQTPRLRGFVPRIDAFLRVDC